MVDDLYLERRTIRGAIERLREIPRELYVGRVGWAAASWLALPVLVGLGIVQGLSSWWSWSVIFAMGIAIIIGSSRMHDRILGTIRKARWEIDRLERLRTKAYQDSVRTRENVVELAVECGLDTRAIALLGMLFTEFGEREFKTPELQCIIDDLSADRCFEAELYWRSFVELVANGFYDGGDGTFAMYQSVWSEIEEKHPMDDDFDIEIVSGPSTAPPTADPVPA